MIPPNVSITWLSFEWKRALDTFLRVVHLPGYDFPCNIWTVWTYPVLQEVGHWGFIVALLSLANGSRGITSCPPVLSTYSMHRCLWNWVKSSACVVYYSLYTTVWIYLIVIHLLVCIGLYLLSFLVYKHCLQ